MSIFSKLKSSHCARDIFGVALFFTTAVCIFGYQFLFYYLPIWGEKIPIHWGTKPMANGWQVASSAFPMLLTSAATLCLILLIIGVLLNRFFIFGTREFRYTPLSFAIICVFMGLFFFAGISESCYASYLAKGIMSNTGMGIFYFILASVFFMIFIATMLTASLVGRRKM